MRPANDSWRWIEPLRWIESRLNPAAAGDATTQLAQPFNRGMHDESMLFAIKL